MTSSWQPSASIDLLHNRANILRQLREFFAARGVMEVETPVLCPTSVTDPYIESIPAASGYLQTSPEYAMKRLLAAGSGPIYQITKAFRQEEIGRYHHPEFTLLEWYRPEWDHHALMDEMDALLQMVLHCGPAARHPYQSLFETHLEFNPHTATLPELRACAEKHKIQLHGDLHGNDDWLNLLLTHCIEPELGQDAPCFIYDFPASQAMLARVRQAKFPVASRFEVYFRGIELANGFHELQDADEQRQRFENNLRVRKEMGLAPMPIDEYFLAALRHGLPDCSGVALGIDRLVMLAAKRDSIRDVMSFAIKG